MDADLETERAASNGRTAPPQVLNYTNLAPVRKPQMIDPIFLPFALGAMLPFLVAAVSAFEIEWGVFGLWVSWGECGALLVASKIRDARVPNGTKTRAWWIGTLAGTANTLALYLIVRTTTARNPFWPMLGAGGSILLAFVLAGSLAAGLAVALFPRN